MSDVDKINILLVDDRLENLIGLQGVLDRDDLNIVTAKSGNIALSLMMEIDFALVLLDVQMPNMDGFETAELMRKNKKTRNVPIIFVTAVSTDKEYMFRGYELGAVDYICKPVDTDLMISKINTFLALEMTRRDLKKTVEELRQEIKKRKKTEEKLRQYELIVANASDLISLVDRDYVYRVVNETYLKNHSKKRKEIIGHTVAELMGETVFINTIKPRLEKCFEGEEVRYEEWFDYSNGQRRYMDVGYYPIFNEDGSVYGAVVTSRDITRIKQYEQQTIESNKMKAVGTLAGGIAHKFNNVLSAIKGNIELLRMDFSQHSGILEFIQRMSESVSEMAGLTSKLIAYAEEGKYQPRKIDVCLFIEETLSLIRHQIDSCVKLEIVQYGNIHEIEGDLPQIQMAITAVVLNGAEAIETTGKVVVSLKNDKRDEGDKDYVCISVEDNGKGMDSEVKARVFEPFFTTYMQGRGLGMSAVYGIVRNHGGQINIDSEPGVGTVVNMWFPAVKKERVSLTESTKAESSQTGTILLIEDEEIVMEVNMAMIKKLGYTVLTAETGREAIDIAENHHGDIDLAILDLVLPDMKGAEIFPSLIKARPEMKVIVCSGYSIDSGAKELLDKGAHGFLQKPFPFADLAGLLKEHINRRKHQRIEVEEGYLSSVEGEESEKIKIIDISEGGFSFSCDKDETNEDGLVKVAVIMSEKGFDISNIECRIVSERLIPNGERGDEIDVKRKSVSFINLNEEQADKLQKFINSCSGT